MSEAEKRKQDVSLKWVKAQSGSTYLCPADALERYDGKPSEEELRSICVDESQNPQND